MVDAICEINVKSLNCILCSILACTEKLHFAVIGQFMHKRSYTLYSKSRNFHCSNIFIGLYGYENWLNKYFSQ